MRAIERDLEPAWSRDLPRSAEAALEMEYHTGDAVLDEGADRLRAPDEAFTRNLIWEFSPLLISAERGDLQNDFIEITQEEANQIVERIRAKVAGTGNG